MGNDHYKISVRCVGCKAERRLTPNQMSKGQPFCPVCGNMELVVEAKKKPKVKS